MQGASPLASPRLSRRRHGLNLRCRCPLGCLPGWSPAALAVPESVGGACFFSRPPTLPLVYFPAPLPRRGRIDPQPPSPPGKGEIKSLFRRGLRPRHPCIRPFAAFTNLSKQEPGAKGSPRFAARMARNAFLWTVPAAKERGDRGRWNYPSQATAAFEMVLSPGAGRTSAAGGTLSRVPQRFFLLPSPQPCFYLLIDNKEKKS